MTREDVIRRIVERELQNQGLAEEVIQQELPDLHQAACEFYGTWDTALQYAGICTRTTRQTSKSRGTGTKSYSDPESVLREIYSLCLNGYSLAPSRNSQRDRRLYDAARSHFGSWSAALIEAGVNIEHSQLRRKPRRLNRDDLIAELRQRQATGQSLVWHQVCVENRALASAIKHAFGSWKQALMLAEIIPVQAATAGRRKWDRQLILDAIRQRHREGKTLLYSRVRKEDSRIVSAARRYFGSWHGAVDAAGPWPEERSAQG